MTTGIRSDGSGTFGALTFGGKDVLNFYPSGNVGIGVSPAANSKLAVGGNTPTAGKAAIVGDPGGISLALSDKINSSLYVKHSNPVTIGTDLGGALAFASNGFTERFRVTSTGDVLVTGGTGLGYGPGAGGTVTQATSKATAVTLNKPCGQVTTHNASLAANAVIGFNFNNTLVGMRDAVILAQQGVGVQATSYEVWASAGTGVFNVYIRNITAGALAEAITINFAIIKGATS